MEGIPFPRGGKPADKVSEKRGPSSSDSQESQQKKKRNKEEAGAGGGSGGASEGNGRDLDNDEILFKVKKQRKVEGMNDLKNQKKKNVNDEKNKNKRKREIKESVQNNIMNVGLGMIKTIGNNKIVKIDQLNYGKYIQGTTALGYILQVTEESLTLSLPGGMIAIVPFGEISDIHHKHIHNIDGQKESALLSEIFQPMNPVRCAILGQLDPSDPTKKTLTASLRGTIVNRGLSINHLTVGFPLTGCVSSIEDRGYLLLSGIFGVNCFLPFTALPPSVALQIGQPVDCIVESVNVTAMTVTLKANRKSVTEAVITESSKLSFNSLQPGMLVDAIIGSPATNGLTVTFLGIFHGVIDISSFSRIPIHDVDWKTRYKEGSHIHARIIFVDQASKSVRLSMRPHVIELRPPKYLPELGEILRDYTVTTVIKKFGVLFTQTNEEDEDTSKENEDSTKKRKKKVIAQKQRDSDERSVSAVFVHRNSLEGGRENWETMYTKGKQSNIRVSGYHLVEGIAVGSNNESFVEGEIVHQSQVEVGQILEVEILKVANFGVVVLLGGKIRGLCPMMHLLESTGTVTQINKRFKIKQKLTMRVWEANGPSIIMTNKKSIVQADDRFVLKSFNDAQEGQIVLGVVSELSQNGLQVHFFNKVKGMLPMSVLVKQGVTDIEQSYQIGQVVRCVILQKTMKSKSQLQLLLGLDIGDTENLLSSTATVTPAQVKEGNDTSLSHQDEEGNDHVENKQSSSSSVENLTPGGTVIKHEGDIIHVRLDDGRLGLLTRDQICDIATFSDAIAKSDSLLPGKRLENLIVLSMSPEQEKKNTVNLSIKPLFLSNLKSSSSSGFAYRQSDLASIPSRVADLSPGQIILGTVWKVETYGILVRFRDGMSALAPRPNVADKFISSPVGMFTVGDSVRCIVQRVDLSRDRAIINLKPVLVPPSNGQGTYLSSYLRESFLATSSSSQLQWKKYPIGTVTRCSVHQIKDYGVILMTSDHVTLMLAKSTEGVAEGDLLDALVLDVDTNSQILEGTIDQTIVRSMKLFNGKGDGKEKKKKKEKFESNSSLDILKSFENISPGDLFRSATILLIKEKYLIASIAQNPSVICYVMIADYHCPYKDTHSYTVGQQIPIRIERVLRAIIPSNEMITPYDQVTIASLFDEESDQHRTKSALVQKEIETSDAKLQEKLNQSSTESLRIGQTLRWIVESIDSVQIHVRPESQELYKEIPISASIHLSSVIDHADGCDDLEASLDKFSALKKKQKALPITPLHPFYEIRQGQVLSAKVIHLWKKKEGDNKDDAKHTTVVTLFAQFQQNDHTVPAKWLNMPQWMGKDIVKAGILYPGVVTHIDSSRVTVALSPFISSQLSYVDVSSDVEIVKKFKANCFVGLRLVLAATAVKTSPHRTLSLSRLAIESVANGQFYADLSTLVSTESIPNAQCTPPPLKSGAIITGLINLFGCSKISRLPAVQVQLPYHQFGRVCVTEIEEIGSWTSDLSPLFVDTEKDNSLLATHEFSGLKHGDLVSFRVLSVPDHGPIELSCRPSRLMATKKKTSIKPDPLPVSGTRVQGYVVNTSSKGCFIRLSSNVTGRVLIKDLSDEFITNPSKAFPPGKLVDALVLNVSEGTSSSAQVNLSMRHSVVLGKDNETELKNLTVGQVVRGVVQRITDFGVFIAIENTSLVGLSRKAMAVPSETTDLKEVYSVGGHVRAKILGIAGPKISLGLKSSYFKEITNDNDESENEESENEDDLIDPSHVEFADDSDEDEIQKLINDAALHSDSEVEDDDEVNEDEEDESDGYESVDDDDEGLPIKKQKVLDNSSIDAFKASSLPTTFTKSSRESGSTDPSSSSSLLNPFSQQSNMILWGSSFQPSVPTEEHEKENENQSEDGSESENEEANGKRKRNRHSTALKAEEEIRKKENALADGVDEPTSIQDFERLLVSSPNSSMLWIQYMSFFLLAADIDAARAVGLRAIRTISFREEDEKYNVWVAMINLEHKYGTDRTLQEVFKRAVTESKSKYIHLQLAELYATSGDLEGARRMFETAIKKHKTSKKVWMKYQHFEQRKRHDKEARALLHRSLLSLSRHKHVEVILQYATVEFELAHYDRGREVFEDLLMSYPKRTDIWNVFVDKEIKYGNYDAARSLFARMVSLKVSSKNIKTIFKKYLNFEMSHGTEAQQDLVKQKAREYVSSIQ